MSKIIIIGSGLAALSSGIFLSKNGHNVTIIEKHFIPGGYATNFSRRSDIGEIITFDISLTGIGNLNKDRSLYNIFEKLEILDKVNLLRKKETGTLIFKNGEMFDFPDSFEEYSINLIKRFPEEKENIINLFTFLKTLDENISKNIYEDFKQFENLTLYEFLKKYTSNEQLINEFSFLWLQYGLPAKKINALSYIMPWLSYHIGGSYYIQGGAGEFSKILANKFIKNGGKILLNKEVTKLNSKNNKIISVSTSKGEIIDGDIFIINSSPHNTLKLIDNYNLVEDYLSKLNNFEESISLTKLFIALDLNPILLGINKSNLFFNNNESTDMGYEKILNKDYKNAHFQLVNYNLLDPYLNKDIGVLSITIGDLEKNWPEYKTHKYEEQKKNVTEILLNKIFELFPNIDGHIIKTELATPKTMKSYTNNFNGSVYGFAQNIENPGCIHINHKTTLDNVYLCSAWTHPGGGYEATLTCALNCSNIIEQNLNKMAKKKLDNTNVILDNQKNTKIENNKENVVNTNSTKDNTLEINDFMQKMLLKINDSYAKKLNKTYKFSFLDIKKDYILKISKGKAKFKNVSSKIDAVIYCNYNIWVNIINKSINIDDAIKNNDINMRGEIDSLDNIKHLFFYVNEKNSLNETKKNPSGKLFILIFLVPWIIYWISTNFLHSLIISYFSIFYTLIIGCFVKPKKLRTYTVLETTTIFAFTVYSLLYSILMPKFYLNNDMFNIIFLLILFLPDIILILFLLISCFFEPMTFQFTKWNYPEHIIKSKLFKKININMTLFFAIIFTLNFIVSKIIPIFFHIYPLNFLIYLDIFIILIIFNIYFKKQLQKELK